LSDTVRKFYDRNANREWERLHRDAYHRLEYIVTIHFLEKYLPKSGLVLDAGGGPGRYPIELGKKGFEVVLFDLSDKCLEIAEREARRARVSTKIRVAQGSIVDFSRFADESFDATICLGALSHLVDEEDRKKAVAELVRVTKTKAPMFISVFNRYGVFRTVLQRLPEELVEPSHEEMFSRGVHRGEWHDPMPVHGFTDAYFFHPVELKEFLESHGIVTLEMATCEGLSCHLQAETNRIYEDKKKWKRWVEILLNTCTDPCILGIGEHVLHIGRKV